MSFPSGHSSAAFAGFGFLALYLNAKLKIICRNMNANLAESPKQQESAQVQQGQTNGIAHWKLIIWILPWLVAVLIAASKVRDGWHHPADVIFGGVVGILFAHMAFHCVYRGVYDGRVNHLPRD